MPNRETSSGRGTCWKREEVLHLLEVWGEARVQGQLAQGGHRNLPVFEQIAAEMARRGYKRTALECRTKTKNMRFLYKKTVVHNSKSGSLRARCPYYEELSRIIHGGVSASPHRAARSLQYQCSQSQAGASQSREANISSIKEEVVDESISPAEEEQDDMHVGDEVVLELVPAEEEEDEEEEEEEDTGGNDGSSDQEQPAMPGNVRHQSDAALGNPVVAPSPPTRIGLLRKRRKRTDKTELMFRQWLEQEKQQHQEFQRTFERDVDESCLFRAEVTQQLRNVKNSLDYSVQVFRDMAESLRSISHDFSRSVDAQIASLHPQDVPPPPPSPHGLVAINFEPPQVGSHSPADEKPSCSFQQADKPNQPRAKPECHSQGLSRKGTRQHRKPQCYSPEN